MVEDQSNSSDWVGIIGCYCHLVSKSPSLSNHIIGTINCSDLPHYKLIEPNLVIIEEGQTARKLQYNFWQWNQLGAICRHENQPTNSHHSHQRNTSILNWVFLGESGGNFHRNNRTKTLASCRPSISKLRTNQRWEEEPRDTYHGNVLMSCDEVSEEVQKRTSRYMMAFPYRAWV